MYSTTILNHLLTKITENGSRYADKYGELGADKPKTVGILSSLLREDVRGAKDEQGLFDLGFLRKLKSDLQSSNSGVYVHVIVDADGSVRFYIGQAVNIRKRIVQQHQNPDYRRKYPSLHYAALNSAVEDFYVVLCTYIESEVDNSATMLNALEMWCGLLFKSLTPERLEEFLPPGFDTTSNGFFGLNVALPLDQGDSRAGKSLADLVKTRDPLAMAYFLRRVREANAASTAVKMDKLRKRLLEGDTFKCTEMKIAGKDGLPPGRVYFRGVAIIIPPEADTSTVFVRCDLSPDEPHPSMCGDQQPGDPACRLGVRVEYVDKKGRKHAEWNHQAGDKNAQKLNSLVDYLEGRTEEYTEKQARRFLDRNKTRGRKSISYTGDGVGDTPTDDEVEASASAPPAKRPKVSED